MIVLKCELRLIWLLLFSPLFVPFINAGASAQELPYLAEVITEKVNIRAGQNENFEKIGKLKKGDRVVVSEQSYAWNKITLPADADSFVAVNLVQEVDDGLGMIKGDRVNIRAGKGTNFAVIGSLKKGTLVHILDKREGWLKIAPGEGIYGWVAAEYLRFVSRDIPPPLVVTPPVKETANIIAPTTAPAAIEIVNVVGLVSPTSSNVSRDIQYQLSGTDNQVYLLNGNAEILGNFTNAYVRIEGRLQRQLKLEHPVVLVTNIQLHM